MRIDSSGNLLVGTTTVNGTGITLGAGDYGYFSRSGDAALFVNRSTSDGDIIELRKADAKVGIIGTLLTNLTIGTGDTGVQFNQDVNALIPHNTTTGANVDNSINLGYSDGGSTNLSFIDLYLSNSALVGDIAGTHVSVESDALDLYRASNPVYINASASNSDLVFRNGTSYTERMRIASNGDILFNTTSVADLTNNAFTFDESTGRVTICSTGTTEPLIVKDTQVTAR